MTGHKALESTFTESAKQAGVALDETAKKITSTGAKGLVKRFVKRNPTMEDIAKAKAKEEVCVEYATAAGTMKAVNWTNKNIVSWIPIANLFNKP